MSDKATKLFDEDGTFLGVFIPAMEWDNVVEQISPILQLKSGPQAALACEEPEPLKDWKYLVDNWDFPYPPDYEVVCEHCGAKTTNWMSDEPRKFRLKSASFSGLVSFQCTSCKSRITKRHFKDGIKFETTPFHKK